MAWAVLAVPAGAADRIYWANSGGNKISYANLDGSGGGDLNTSGATMNGPSGVTIYPGAGRIYWANRNANKISFARLGGGGDFNTGGVTVSAPTGVTLYHALGGAGHPQPFEQIYWPTSARTRSPARTWTGAAVARRGSATRAERP